MRRYLSISCAAALLAAFGMAAVTMSRAEEKKPGEAKKVEDAPKVSAAAQEVEDIATANNLIDYGRRTNNPTALIAGVQMLVKMNDPKEELKAEGAGKGEVSDKKKALQMIMAEARKMEGIKNPAVQTLADQTDDLVAMSRGTAGQHTSWSGIVLPTNQSTGNPATVIRRNFLGKQLARITVHKTFNAGVPLDVRIYDGNNTLISHRTGNSVTYESIPAKDQTYQIVIRNYHSVGVQVQVTTN